MAHRKAKPLLCWRKPLCLVVALVSLATSQSLEYGVDVSWPMHHVNISTNYDGSIPDMPLQPLGNRKALHDDFMAKCHGITNPEKAAVGLCQANEEGRVAMGLRQPRSMHNYTRAGFTKIRAPDHVFKLIRQFWEDNKDQAKPEKRPAGDIYINHWDSQPTMVSLEDMSLKGAGNVLKQHIWNAARETMQEWTGQRQIECSLYGIRVYHTGAILSTHVDRLPLVSSAIINVDQDVDEPWPLEVIGHDGKAHNITMVPGDLVLYESHSILHGRPFPLKGRFMANVFLHFEPIGPKGGQVEYTGDLPPYIIPGSPEESHWRRFNPSGHKLLSGLAFETGSTEAHTLASTGKLEELHQVLREDTSVVNVRDRNGWTPLHEAVRHGNVDVVKLLLEHGADANARTGRNGEGGSPLYYVVLYHDPTSHEYQQPTNTDQTISVQQQLTSLLEAYDGKVHSPTFRSEL